LSIKRQFRGVMYNIAVTRTGKPSLSVDGKAVAGNIVPPVAGKAEVEVAVTI
jgi:cellobiose phosphorylase